MDSDNSQLISRNKIENTPFEIVGSDERGYFIALGRYKLTTNKPTLNEARECLVKEQYNIIANMIAVIFDVNNLEN